ncbi:hypothetical protein [Hymenobacter perfusus]|uniref:Uncharacterized protein n=1 Tax=Hymenobacter perfusus TaxID=1236770 RepID=A0A3R9V1I5_9BACT|nr:hypothetical protein [Hymenobacter perfusus]RSK44691.1 hypothetical protein EI293_09275 [Hymenobacter perfusus]
MLDLTHLSQQVPLWPEEARVLRAALEHHLEHLNGRSAQGQLTLLDALALRPLSRVHQQLTRMLCGLWPRHERRPGRPHRQRRWRLSFEELLLLNRLYSDGTLAACLEGPPRVELLRIGGEMHRAAQNLSYYFRL